MSAPDPVMQAMTNDYMGSRSASDCTTTGMQTTGSTLSAEIQDLCWKMREREEANAIRYQSESASESKSLRERIVMALITSPQPIADMIMAAKALEAYITGEAKS